MKKLTFLLCCMLYVAAANAQFNILDRAKQKVKDKVNQKVDQKMDKAVGAGVDTVDNAISRPVKKNKANNGNTNSGDNNSNNSSNNNVGANTDVIATTNTTPASLKSYSKFDFVPGEKIVSAEDFSQDAVGDFPAKWNTNGSGEVVTLNNASGKFLMTQKAAIFYPEWIKDLPDNFTTEFDLVCTDQFSFYSGFFNVGFTTNTNVGKNFNLFSMFGNGRIDNGGGVEMGFQPEDASGSMGMTRFYASQHNTEALNTNISQDKFVQGRKTMVHIAIWRQKSRVRVYMDDKKVWDLPRAIADGLQLHTLYFRNDGAANENDAFYMANFRLAVGAPDTRNKLITEGKFVTHGILFDVNSAQIKPESYGTLKDIAAVLSENTGVKVLITGHTDSDGDDAANLSLSKRRAEAVKTSLVKDFNIDASRMQTDGKGESQPIDNNSTSTGKANNRRVEFVKQ